MNCHKFMKEMQASYLIKGSLRFAADNLRVSINLIDAKHCQIYGQIIMIENLRSVAYFKFKMRL